MPRPARCSTVKSVWSRRWDTRDWPGAPRWVARPRRVPPLLIGLVQVLGTSIATRHAVPGTGRHLDVLGYALLVAGPAALVGLRFSGPGPRSRLIPPWVLVGALAPTIGYFARGYPYGPGFFAVILAIFAAVQAGWRRFSWAAVGVAYLAWALLALSLRTAGPGQLVTVAVWSLVVIGFAEASRIRRERFSEMARARLEQQRSEAERRRASDEQERRQASEERLRIAQELHDVIGHHLSLINVQAGVGLHLMDEHPEQAQAALAAIKHASSEALRETRAVLAALRPQEPPPLAPTPGRAWLRRYGRPACRWRCRWTVRGSRRPRSTGRRTASCRKP